MSTVNAPCAIPGMTQSLSLDIGMNISEPLHNCSCLVKICFMPIIHCVGGAAKYFPLF